MDVAHAARLHTRYQDCKLSLDLHPMLMRAITRWGFSIKELQAQALSLWSSGWRPDSNHPETIQVGSGADVQE
jgi:hypothetical protein